jgi:small subunit ribosomal protein S2
VFVSVVAVQELIEAGVHYGHRVSKWNPKMRPYIYGKRNLIHIIDLRETVRGLIRAQKFIERVAAQGSLVLFVGTKRQAQQSIIREAKRAFSPFVSERWIGGTFTNFRTIRSRLQRLNELESLIQTGEINAYSKKRKATLLRELKKVQRNLSGVRTMNRLPGAMVVVDAKAEATALREARKMGIPTLALIDTDSDPDMVDLVVPGNDDSIRSIDLVLSRLTDAVLKGTGQLPKEQVERLNNDFTRAHTPLSTEHLQPVKESVAVNDGAEKSSDKDSVESAEPAVAE